MRFPDQPPRAWTLPSTSLHLRFPLLCWMCLISFSHIFFSSLSFTTPQRGYRGLQPYTLPTVVGAVLPGASRALSRQSGEPGEKAGAWQACGGGSAFFFFPFLSSIKLMQQTHTVTLYWRSYVYNFSFIYKFCFVFLCTSYIH